MKRKTETTCPVDVTTLYKGQILETAELESLLGVSHKSSEWPFKMLWLRHKIGTTRDKRNLPLLTMRFCRDTLVICTDEEAAEYNRRGTRLAGRKQHRHYRQNIAVDASKLTPEDAACHSRTLMRQALVMAAIRSARNRMMPPTPHEAGVERVTPKMVVHS